MLQNLFVDNIALIDHLEIEFAEGFNVLTGETGAGKSLVVDSVNLVLGERADRDLIKHDQEKAKVQAIFHINNERVISHIANLGFECEDGQLILSRELSVSGKNICRINGNLVSLGMLKQIGDILVDVHGQHTHQSLLNTSHLAFLDEFGTERLKPYLDKLAVTADELKMISDRVNAKFEDVQRIDLLRFQINEIEAAKLSTAEEDVLENERELLVNAEQIMMMLERGYELICGGENGGAQNALQRVFTESDQFASLGKDFSQLNTQLGEAYYTLESAALTLRDIRASFEFDPKRLDDIENRLDQINSIKRKYGMNVDELLKYKHDAQIELDDIIEASQNREMLIEKQSQLKSKYLVQSHELSAERMKIAETLEKGVIEKMKRLGFERPRFKVAFSKIPKSEKDISYFSKAGTDEVELMLSVNAGEDLKPLSKIASGGEISRIMLGIKTITADSDNIETLVFDEIDTGISGRIAGIVGEEMKKISQLHQVICVTHQPQIAALADAHFMIEKYQDETHTDISIKLLDDNERIIEVARIMSGNEKSSPALEHARELLLRGKN
jgi:DNA repair protein RecN (Recombination protein N)